jgi:hypothetical protein
MSFVLKEEAPFEEKILWAAVLRRAVFDYVLYKGVRAHSLEWKRAFQYIFSEGVRYEVGLSFEDVCGLFGWEPGYLRRLVTRLTRADVKKMEIGQVRSEFLFNLVASAVERTQRWASFKAAVPFFPKFDYSQEYREALEPWVVWEESYSSFVPKVHWHIEAA